MDKKLEETSIGEQVRAYRERQEHERREHEQSAAVMLNNATIHYSAEEYASGDMAAAEWLIRIRSVKTDRRNKLYAYNPELGHYQQEGEIILKKDLILQFKALATRTRVAEVLAKVHALSYMSDEELEASTPPNLIPLENGVYDLNLHILLPHSPEYCFSYKHPVMFNPDATCPRIEAFLNRIVSTERDREILLDIPALIFLRQRVTRRFFILVGNGHNGKSIYLSISRTIIGKNRIVSITPQALAEDVFADAQLFDKHANLGADIPGGILHKTDLIKAATGGDPISVQHKGVDRVEREIYCEFVWASNDPPRITEDTDAIWSRVVVVLFPYKFEKVPKEPNERLAIPNLETQLLTPEELSGFFNVLRKRMHHLLTTRDISVEVEAETARREYRAISDTPAVFAEEMCEETPYEPSDAFTKAKGYVTAEEAYRAYKNWCQELRITPVSANRFGRAMEKLGYQKGKDEQVRTYRGLQLSKLAETKSPEPSEKSEEPGTLRTVRTDSPILPAGESLQNNIREKSLLTVQSVSDLTVRYDDFTKGSGPSTDYKEIITDERSLLTYLRSASLPMPRGVILESVDVRVGNYAYPGNPGFWLDVTLKALKKEAKVISIGADSWTVLE